MGRECTSLRADDRRLLARAKSHVDGAYAAVGLAEVSNDVSHKDLVS